MRKLMWFTIGFSAGCAIGANWIGGFWLLLLSFLFAFIAVMTYVGTSEKCQIARLLFLGCSAALLWVCLFHWIYLSPVKAVDGETVTASIEITDYHTETDWGISADGKIKLDGKNYKIRVYSDDLLPLAPGDRVKCDVRLRLTMFGQQEDTYHGANGIYLLGYLPEEVTVESGNTVPFRYFAVSLKRNITNLMDEMLPTDVVAFARALLLGDRTLLDYKTSSDLSVSGIRHVVAVSGLHVSILFSVLFALFGYRRVVTPVVGWLVLLVFAGITGFTPSVVRACIMHGLMLGALMLQKEYDSPTALACAVLIMLIANPMAITSAALQLSAGCVIGIMLFSERIRDALLETKLLGGGKTKNFLSRLKRSIAGSMSITLSTWITTTPLCAVYFGTISLIGVLTNLLTLCVVTVIFCGLLLACAAGAIYLPAGQCIAWLISWAIRYVLFIAKTLAAVPFAAVYTASPYIVAWVVFCYVLLILQVKLKEKGLWRLILCVALSLVIAVGASRIEPMLDDYRVSILDVGQGQCILIQQDGKNYIVDCGGDTDEKAADTAAQTLLFQGVRKLDGIIITHFDADHAGGVGYLLSRIPADKIYISEAEKDGPICRELANAYPQSVCWIHPDSTVIIPDAGITLYAGNNLTSDNESGLCVLFQSGNCDILITGDRSIAGEKLLLTQAELPDLEVLVVGHHGAKTSTGLDLLSVTMPDLAVISVSKTNDYGHPSTQVLERLALFGCRILRTDEQGTILIRG